MPGRRPPGIPGRRCNMTAKMEALNYNTTMENISKSDFCVFGLTPDTWAFIAIILGTNLHIFTGNITLDFVFLPGPAFSGEWHRFLTHPFFHVSWYHLLLDGGAFFLLYTGLEQKRFGVKLLYIVVCGAFSLMLVIFCSPLVDTIGLCGLSGIAHGLMVISGLEMVERKETRTIGFISILITVAKGIYEFITGHVLFSFLQFDMCGIPIAICHTGGIMGGFFVYFLILFSGLAANIDKKYRS